MLGEIDITELINKIKDGDKRAQEKLYKYYKKKIDYFLRDKYPYNGDVDDDVSEILFKVFQSIKKYDLKKSKFNTWVINIAKNYMIDKSRKQKPLYTNFADAAIDYSNNNTSTFSVDNATSQSFIFTTTNCTMPEPESYYCAPDFDLEMSSSISFASTSIGCSSDFSMITMKNSGYNYKEIGLEFNLTESQVSNKINYIKTKMKDKGEE